MREKGIDGRHAEADSLGLGNQPGTTPFVNASAFTVGYLQITSGLPVVLPRSMIENRPITLLGRTTDPIFDILLHVQTSKRQSQ